MWEVLLWMHMLQTDDEPAVFGAWRQWARARLTEVEREVLKPLHRSGTRRTS